MSALRIIGKSGLKYSFYQQGDKYYMFKPIGDNKTQRVEISRERYEEAVTYSASMN